MPDQGQTQDISSNRLMDVLGLLGAGGLAKGAAVAAKSGPALSGLFIGPRATTWDKAAASKARASFRRGDTPEQVFDDTNLFRGWEGRLRREISNNVTPYPFGQAVKSEEAIGGPLSRLIHYPELFENYPHLSRHKAWVVPDFEHEGGILGEKRGPADPGSIILGGSVDPRGLTVRQLGALLHEVGHKVQEFEGWPEGGHPSDVHENIGNVLMNRVPSLTPENASDIVSKYEQLGNNWAQKGYWWLPGEAEASNIKDRYFIDNFGVPFNTPMASNADEVARLLKSHGTDLSHNLQPFQGNTIIPNLNIRNYEVRGGVPPELKETFERLPVLETQTGQPVRMVGDPRYPWKTERVQRDLQAPYNSPSLSQDQLDKLMEFK